MRCFVKKIKNSAHCPSFEIITHLLVAETQLHLFQKQIRMIKITELMTKMK